MKRKLMTVLTLLLCLVTAFGFTACGDKDNGGNGGGGAGTKVALGTAVQQVATATLNEQNVNVGLDISTNMGAVSIDMTGDLYAKKATNGYDFFLSVTGDYQGASSAPNPNNPNVSAGPVNATPDPTSYVKIWCIDGVGLVGLSQDGTTYAYDEAKYLGTLDDLLSMTGMPVTMQTLPGMLEQIKNVGGEVEKKNGKFAVAIDEDMTADYKAEITWLKNNINKPVGEAVAAKLGKTATQLDADLAEVFAAGQKVSGLVGKLDAFLAKYGFTQTLKQMIDSVQSMTGMSTTEIVDMIKANMAPSMAAQLPAITGNQTLYDYFMAAFGEVNVDEMVAAFTEQPTATLKTLYDGMIKTSLFGADAATLGEVIDMVLGKFELQVTAEALTQLSINTVKLGLTLDTDTSNRLTKLKVALKVDVGVTGQTQKVADLDYDVDLTFTYNADNVAKIAFPSDAEIEPMVKAIEDLRIDGEAARQTGYTLNVFPGANTEKVLTIPKIDICVYGQQDVTMTPNANGEYKLADSNVVLATFKDNKIVLKKEIFAIEDLESVDIRVDIDGAYNTWVYVYVNNSMGGNVNG